MLGAFWAEEKRVHDECVGHLVVRGAAQEEEHLVVRSRMRICPLKGAGNGFLTGTI